MEKYRKRLIGLQRIRDLTAGVDLSLPQIAVVGDQSSGKSSVLSEVTGVHFPVNSGICTKAPIVVQCMHKADQNDTRYFVGVEKREVTLDSLANEIMKIQDAAIGPSADKKISTDEIRVFAEGANQIDVILVDLPGIINVGPGKEETRALINKYIEKDQTLIMLVSEAKQDDELVTAMELARKVDPEGMRTMRVLTKFDTFDSVDAKDRASQLVKVDVTFPNDGIPSTVSLSPHAVVCRSSGGSYNGQAEADALQHLPKERAGVGALKDRLPSIFGELINTNLPKLEAAIRDKFQEAEDNLKQLGEEPMSKSEMIKHAQDLLQKRTSEYEETISEYVKTFQDLIHASKDGISKEWADLKYRPNMFRNPLFQGEAAVDSCMKEICLWWKTPLDALLSAVSSHAKAHVALVLRDTSRLPRMFIDTVDKVWSNFCDESTKSLTSMCEKERTREIEYGTMNHYLTAKFTADMIMPKELIDRVVQGVALSPNSPYYLADIQNELSKRLGEVKAALEKEYEAKDIHEQQKERVFRAVEALWAVEHKTFSDNILKTLRDSLIKERERWVLQELWMSEKIRESAVEDSRTQVRRKEFQSIIQKMKECLQELRLISEV